MSAQRWCRLSIGHVVLSTGEGFDSEIVVWTAGNAANPMVAKHTDLPVDRRGRLLVRSDLRVGTQALPVSDVWGAGDNATVPDLVAGRSDAFGVPNAQHAERQGKRLAANITASIRGRDTRPYRHRNLGVAAILDIGRGVFQSGPIVIKGFPAWLMHRGYHLLVVPTWDRKVCVMTVWFGALLFGRDVVSLDSVQRPRAAFVESWAGIAG